MKVLMINSVCGIRSTGRICTDLAEKLSKEGQEVKIAYGREAYVPEQYRKYAVRIGNSWDVRFHALKARLFDASGFGSKRATRKFIAWVKEFDPDVIHLHNLHGYYINIEILFNYLRTCNKKIIWTLHDCWAFTGHCCHFSYIKCEKWKTQCYRCEQIHQYPRSIVIDKSRGNYLKKKELFSGIKDLTIITPSIWLANLVKQSFLYEYQIEVRYNEVNKEIFKPTPSEFRKEYGINDDRKMILGVASNWNERKGLNDFIRLSELLGKEYIIVLVGLNKKQMRLVPGSIVGIERTNSQRDLAKIYSAADVFVNLSVEETFGLATVEAISCGTPAIVYKNTGNEEIAKEYGGICVEYGLKNIIGAIKSVKYE